jgi:hypothetical protein
VSDDFTVATRHLHCCSIGNEEVKCLVTWCVPVQVLRDIKRVEPFQWSEVHRMRTTLLTRDEADLKDNNHILNLLTHLQAADVPLKTIDLLRDMPAMINVCIMTPIPSCAQPADTHKATGAVNHECLPCTSSHTHRLGVWRRGAREAVSSLGFLLSLLWLSKQ